MKLVHGIFADAKIFTEQIDDYALSQIQMLCDNEASKNSTIRIMPDVHPGNVATIGLTMTIQERIIPNLVGIDIGCGMMAIQIKQKKLEYQKLDTVIREKIPSGSAIRQRSHHFSNDFDFSLLRCYKHINEEKARQSMGSLGGGNHFIEVDISSNGTLYLVIHSGSRHLGKEVTDYYLTIGSRKLKEKSISVPYPLVYLTDQLMEDYIHDVKIVQEFAALNRAVIADELIKGMKLKPIEHFSVIHNYIDTEHTPYVLRKGAISAKQGERLVIPINMRDGILLATGKGNPDWNYSAPHGSGRILKREDVKNHHTVSQFKSEMKGVYCSCINSNTLEESPFAYRGIDEITAAISETAIIDEILKPVYNFKSTEK